MPSRAAFFMRLVPRLPQPAVREHWDAPAVNMQKPSPISFQPSAIQKPPRLHAPARPHLPQFRHAGAEPRRRTWGKHQNLANRFWPRTVLTSGCGARCARAVLWKLGKAFSPQPSTLRRQPEGSTLLRPAAGWVLAQRGAQSAREKPKTRACWPCRLQKNAWISRAASAPGVPKPGSFGPKNRVAVLRPKFAGPPSSPPSAGKLPPIVVTVLLLAVVGNIGA